MNIWKIFLLLWNALIVAGSVKLYLEKNIEKYIFIMMLVVYSLMFIAIFNA